MAYILKFDIFTQGDIFTQRAKERVDRRVAEAMLKAAESVPVKVFITAPAEGGNTLLIKILL